MLRALSEQWKGDDVVRRFFGITFCAPEVTYPTFDELSSSAKVCGYAEPIPAQPDRYLTWPGKDQGKPKPPVLWIDRNGVTWHDRPDIAESLPPIMVDLTKAVEWVETFNGYWPDWSDSGKAIEAIKDDGSMIEGVLHCSDFGFDGEDEFPIWEIVVKDGQIHSFCDTEKYRFTA